MSDAVQDMLMRDLQREYNGLAEANATLQQQIEALKDFIYHQSEEIERLEKQLNECRNREKVFSQG